MTALNNLMETQHRWCTPSILHDQQKVQDEYDDVSVSAGALGNLLQHTGYFQDAEEFAAKVYGADHTFLSPHGSTGANAIVLRMLALERRDALVLVSRNVHHSVINALKMFSVDFRFLPNPSYDPHFEAILPPRPSDVVEGLSRYPETLAVIYTSPTYEGITASTEGIAEFIHDEHPEVIVAVDEAWGGHLPFHPDLPKPAMESGADIAVQSTHKMAGSLQQGALIHWAEREHGVDSETMGEAYREYVTTSPSYHLIGSIDASLRLLDEKGPEYLTMSIERSRALREALATRLPGLRILGVTDLQQYATSKHLDAIKTTLGLSSYQVSGFALAKELANRDVIVERAGLNSIVLVTTFQLEDDAVEHAVEAISQSLEGKEVAKGKKKNLPRNPFAGCGGPQTLRPYEVVRYAKFMSTEVPLGKAVGRVAAESVELYPPGVPILLEGYTVTPEAVRYLRATLREGAQLVARDKELRRLRVLGQPS